MGDRRVPRGLLSLACALGRLHGQTFVTMNVDRDDHCSAKSINPDARNVTQWEINEYFEAFE